MYDNNGVWGIVKQFCIIFGTECSISICGGHVSDRTELIFHRVASFRVKHLKLDDEQTRRSKILLELSHKLPKLKLLFLFSTNQTINSPIFRSNGRFFLQTLENELFEITLIFMLLNTAKLVSYILI